MIEITLTSKKNGKAFPVEISSDAPNFNVLIKAFGVWVKFTNYPENGDCIKISKYMFLGVQKELELFFDTKIKESNIWITITPESADEIRKTLNVLALQRKVWERERDTAASKLPLSYEMHDFLDWGDCTSNHERHVRVTRDPLEEFLEKDRVTTKTFVLDGMDIDSMEWIADLRAAGGDVNNDMVNVSEEVGKKWIGVHDAACEQLEKDARELENIRELDNLLAETVRAEKFARAAATGEPVVLSSRFLSREEMLRHYWDEDSNMSTLYVVAMPDGSTDECVGYPY